MPNVIVPLDITYENITRRMVHSVVSQVMGYTGLSTDIPIRFYGALGKNYQPGSTIDGGEANLFDTSHKVTVTALEEYKEDAIINTPVRYQDAKPIFEDRALEILLKPIYSDTLVTLDFTYRAPTRMEVERWRDDVKVRAGDNRQAHLHELEYHYPIPGYALIVIHHLFSLREAQAGYGESYGTYLKRCFNPNATTIANQNAQKTLLVIKERQIGVQGWFEFTEPPAPETGEAGTSWSINFTYRFTYQKAVSTNFLYPLVVHNQFIDHKFYSDEPVYDPIRHNRYTGDVKKSYDSLIEMYKKPDDPMGGLRFPQFDEWVPEFVPNFTTSFVTWMMQVDPATPTALLDLDELGDWYLHPIIADFLRESEYPYLNVRGESILNLGLFKNAVPMGEPCLTCDKELMVTSNYPLDLRGFYHLRLSAITEISLLSERAIEALIKNGQAALLIFQSILNNLDIEYAAGYLINGKELPRWYIDWFFNHLRDQGVGNTGGDISSAGPRDGWYHIDWPLVEYLTIIAKREES